MSSSSYKKLTILDKENECLRFGYNSSYSYVPTYDNFYQNVVRKSTNNSITIQSGNFKQNEETSSDDYNLYYLNQKLMVKLDVINDILNLHLVLDEESGKVVDTTNSFEYDFVFDLISTDIRVYDDIDNQTYYPGYRDYKNQNFYLYYLTEYTLNVTKSADNGYTYLVIDFNCVIPKRNLIKNDDRTKINSIAKNIVIYPNYSITPIKKTVVDSKNYYDCVRFTYVKKDESVKSVSAYDKPLKLNIAFNVGSGWNLDSYPSVNFEYKFDYSDNWSTETVNINDLGQLNLTIQQPTNKNTGEIYLRATNNYYCVFSKELTKNSLTSGFSITGINSSGEEENLQDIVLGAVEGNILALAEYDNDKLSKFLKSNNTDTLLYNNVNLDNLYLYDAMFLDIQDDKYNPNQLFENCNNLLIVPDFKITDLTNRNYCYYAMYKGCTSLLKIPKLTATVLSIGCYSYMFDSCESISDNYLDLPLTNLADFCYSHMFSNCTAIVTSPKLPASQLKDGCYSYMFSGCTNLTKPSDLNAEILANNCYEGMYSYCTSLTKPPDLPLLDISGNDFSSNYCCRSMFENCTSIIQPPSIQFVGTSIGCYNNMFKNCTSLNKLPRLNILSGIKDNSLASMFEGCTSLTDVSYNLNFTSGVGACKAMFKNCSNIANLNIRLNANPDENTYASMFEGCSKITVTPELPALKLKAGSYAYMFKNCTSLTRTPNLPATTVINNDINKYGPYEGMFEGCSGLTTMPEMNVDSLCTNIYAYMFKDCTSLSISKNYLSNYSTLAPGCFKGMFDGCTLLELPLDLPAKNMEVSCYEGMFANCTSLKYPPLLESTNLAQNCYKDMFKNIEQNIISRSRNNVFMYRYDFPSSILNNELFVFSNDVIYNAQYKYYIKDNAYNTYNPQKFGYMLFMPVEANKT